MAIKLLGQVWRAAGTASAAASPRRGLEWGVERREPSPWHPVAKVGSAMRSTPAEPRPAEPVWAETQPWCHD